jgi:hypothetical protein
MSYSMCVWMNVMTIHVSTELSIQAWIVYDDNSSIDFYF